MQLAQINVTNTEKFDAYIFFVRHVFRILIDNLRNAICKPINHVITIDIVEDLE